MSKPLDKYRQIAKFTEYIKFPQSRALCMMLVTYVVKKKKQTIQIIHCRSITNKCFAYFLLQSNL